MPRYRKKPIVIEAIQFTVDNFNEICNFIGDENLTDGTSQNQLYIGIVTLEGEIGASIGDFIIEGVDGEFYPCKSNIFEMTYELAEN